MQSPCALGICTSFRQLARISNNVGHNLTAFITGTGAGGIVLSAFSCCFKYINVIMDRARSLFTLDGRQKKHIHVTEDKL